VPPQTFSLPRWVPGQTIVSNGQNRGSFNFNTSGAASVSGWGSWSGTSTQSTYIPGYLTTDTYTKSGYYSGAYYPTLAVQVFDGKSFNQTWASIGAGCSNNSDLRISSQLVLSKMIIQEFPISSSLSTNSPDTTALIGISCVIMTNSGNDYYPFIVHIKPKSPAARSILRPYDIITEINGVPTRNLPLSKVKEMISDKRNDFLSLKVYRLEKEIDVYIYRK
jgi:S1-C subfamily serine protease